MLGLRAVSGVPDRPDGPVRGLPGASARAARRWCRWPAATARRRAGSPFGKFPVKTREADGKYDAARLADRVAEGLIGRLVRAQLSKGPREKGKLTYLLRIDNASPLILSGLAIQGGASKADDPMKVLTSIGIPPRKYLTLPASEDVVKALGLKQGVRITALDLSGL